MWSRFIGDDNCLMFQTYCRRHSSCTTAAAGDHHVWRKYSLVIILSCYFTLTLAAGGVEEREKNHGGEAASMPGTFTSAHDRIIRRHARTSQDATVIPAAPADMIVPQQPWMLTTDSECQGFLKLINKFEGEPGWCPGVTDEVLCWPAAPPNSIARQSCPHMQGVDPSKFAKKECDAYGQWKGRDNDGDISLGIAGYTHYDDCFTEETKQLFETFLGLSNDSADGNIRFAIVFDSRKIEMVGFPFSLVCVLISLFIFRHFRSLRNPRTTIHVHLFSAIAIMMLSKTIEIYDQHFSGYVGGSKAVGEIAGIRSVTPLCELLIVLVEYSRIYMLAFDQCFFTIHSPIVVALYREAIVTFTALPCQHTDICLLQTTMFMWMFLEGLYMHNVVAWKVFETAKPNYFLYCAIGWGFPAFLVALWAPLVEFVWRQQKLDSNSSDSEANNTIMVAHADCWYQHNFSSYYYILEVPRLCFIGINLIFLVNIVRVLLTKLRDSHQSDTVQIRKAIKATIVLAPLLGITHLIWAVPPPIQSSIPIAAFASWMYISHFVRSFEGFFVCLVYCFLNGEVRAAVKASCQRRAIQRETNRSAARRVSSLSSSHLTRYMQVNRESVQSEIHRREPSNRFVKLFPCWTNSRMREANGSARGSRKASQINTDYNTSTLNFPFNGTIKEEKEENIEM